MKYCSECGVPISRQWVAQEKRQRYVCAACGTTHYQNPRVLVNCIVCWQDKILMCRRSEEPARGQWIIPSGFLECGETLEEGAARETLEETGVVVDPARLELSSIMNMTIVDQVAITFRTEVDARPEIIPGAECLEVAFLSEREIPPSEFAWRDAMGSLPPQVFAELRAREYSIRLASIATPQGVGFKSRLYKIQSIAAADEQP